VTHGIKAAQIFNQVAQLERGEGNLVHQLIDLGNEGFTAADEARRAYFQLIEKLAQLTADTRKS
jgi:hypothetical protein